jgi:hypothetical protein
MKPLVSTFAFALIVCASTPAVAQTPAPSKSSVAKSQAEARRIVEGQEFQTAVRSKDIARMNDLLKGTGVVVANPVALFYCKPPSVAVYRNGAWYCGAKKVEPFMYAD